MIRIIFSVVLLFASTAFTAPVFRVAMDYETLLKAWDPDEDKVASERRNTAYLTLLPSADQYAIGWDALPVAERDALIVEALVEQGRMLGEVPEILLTPRFEALYQAQKSVLHKAADNALVAVLIRGGFLPEGTTEVPAGTEATVTASLLQAEVLDPTNATIQALSTKLARIKTIIKEEGGEPDDAIVHQ